ncbi:MAG: hypothetical protein IT282_07870 [Bacteroidetes bacterium]|nr:hypothetical protein [Bacteroidota bacterium]
MKRKNLESTASLTLFLLAFLLMGGCASDEDTALAPYTERPTRLSKVAIQDSTFTPKVTWVGGYVAAFGVNTGSRAALDASLAWLVAQSGNTLRYPITIGQLPSGAQDLTAQFGGTPRSQLTEDSTYTYWVMTADAWDLVRQLPEASRRTLTVDTSATAIVQSRNDTAFVRAASCAIMTRRTDVFINIDDFRPYGRLATLGLIHTGTSNNPTITWQIRDAGVDTAISAIGIVRGQTYEVANVVWEMISAIELPDTTIYWVNNVIRGPIVAGTQLPNTQTFTEYPAGGLERGYSYMLWIANKDWDREGRLRSTPNYAYALFTVW